MKKAFVVLSAMLLLTLMACGGGDSTPLPTTTTTPTPTPLSSAKAITAFSLNGVAGTINETGKTIAVAMPSGTNVTALVATFTTTGVSVEVGSTLQETGTTANNYTSPVIYTVTAEDATTQNYTVTVTLPALLVFVTSTTHDGNLGGVSGGDAICQARATAASLPGTYKAWLSDNTTDAYCHVQGFTGKKAANCGQGTLPVAAGPWVRTDNYPFTGTIDKLVTGQIFAPVRYNESGVLVTFTEYYFTDTKIDGTLGNSGCNNWTSNGAVNALYGSTNGATGGWTASGGSLCSAPSRLLCFQTGTGGPLPIITAPPASKKVFVTSTTYKGDLGGISGGDAKCQTRATAAGLSGTYKAWLSDSTHDAKDNLTSAGPWYRLDGVKVADTKAALAVMPLFSAISQTETGAYFNAQYYQVWSGTDASGIKIVGKHCNNWINNTAAFSGEMGLASRSDNDWASWTEITCDNEGALYCFED